MSPTMAPIPVEAAGGIRESASFKILSDGVGSAIGTTDSDNNGTLDGDEDPDNDGLTSVQELQKNAGLDPGDPDTDGDQIDDNLDDEPITPSNTCTGGTAAVATFADLVTSKVTCAATTSITVDNTVIQGVGHLQLISPLIKVGPPFTSGGFSVISKHPCATCP